MITLGGILATALIGSITNIVLAKIKSSNQNKEKSDHESRKSSEEERRSSDLSHRSARERKNGTCERKKSLCSQGLDFTQERQSVCSKKQKGRRSPDETGSKKCNDENKKMITTQLAVSGVTKYTAVKSIISKEDQLSSGMDGSVEGRPPSRNLQLQSQYDTDELDENISTSDVTTIIKVETQETESNLA